MVFSSPFFIFAFLPLTFFAERLCRGPRAKNAALITASLLFYSFGQLKCLPLLLASVAVNYLAGLAIMKLSGRGSARQSKLVLTIAVLLNIAVLCIYKYVDFFSANLNALFSLSLRQLRLELPLGISFYTFQGISYVTDVYRKPERGTKNFGRVLLYIAFFPRLIAGPIVEYADMGDQLAARETSNELTLHGIKRFVTGFGKKLLLSAGAGYIADTVFALVNDSAVDCRLAWLGALCYTLQIYFDFSGYSDMAIGLGELFGFRIKENFNHPLSACGIKDFWRRWHISLSTWFRDYIYIPLGGNRRGKGRAFMNRMVVFLVTGLWHGANWTFIIWGIIHGILSGMEDAGIIPVKKLSKTAAGRLVCRAYTFLAVMLLFVLFRADSLGQAGLYMVSLFSFTGSAEGAMYLSRLLTPAAITVIVLACVTSFAGEKLPVFAKPDGESKTACIIEAVLLPVIFVLSCLSMAAGQFSPFIYFQF